MKTEIIKIADDLRNGVVTTEQARTLLLGLFGVSGSYSAEDMSKAWSEGYHRKVDEINCNELRYFDVWLANYR
jgi:hypothetical protein